MASTSIRRGFLYPFLVMWTAAVMLTACGGSDGGGGAPVADATPVAGATPANGTPPATGTPATGTPPADGTPPASGTPPVSAAQTWFFPDDAALTPAQIASFDAQGLYFNAHTAANPGGEIRDQIVPSSAAFVTDAGSLATGNTFSTLMSSDQEVPAVSSAATGYGTIVLDPAAKTISGVLVTNGIVGTAAHIHEGAPDVAGPVIIPLSGGPTVWTVPAGTAVSDDQIAKLRAGAYYLNVHTEGAPGGEIRGQLTQQLRFAALSGANEVPAVTTAASGNGVLALDPATNAIRGFVRSTGVTGTAAHIHEAAAGVAGPVIIPLEETPAGSGVWTIPDGQTLTADQVASFNAGNLYFNVHSAANPGGEIRGQIVPATIRIGNAALSGANEVPPVTTSASGTGIMALNSVTGRVAGNLSTSGLTATAAHVHEGAAGANGPVIIPLSLTPPPSTLAPAPAEPAPPAEPAAPAAPAPVSFSTQIQPILTANCVVCHSPGGQGGFMNLTEGNAYASLVPQRVTAGNSAGSLLYQRITGAVQPQMPLGRTPLSEGDQTLIKNWIDQGAPNN